MRREETKSVSNMNRSYKNSKLRSVSTLRSQINLKRVVWLFFQQIEQQMKLYAESLQEKLDEYEKGKGSSSKVDSSALEVALLV